MSKEARNYRVYLIGVGVLLLAALGGGYYYYSLQTKELALATNDLTNAKSDIAQLQEKLAETEAALEAEKYKYSLFSGQIQEITSTVGTLDKLSKTDKELLQKYSKVYFLNEHYVPDSLTNLPPDYLYETTREMKVHEKVYPYLQQMMADAAKAGADLKIISAYRSFSDQTALKTGYSVSYGSGANKFSADQGYSEHQLGTAIDFTTPKTGSDFNSFKNTETYDWLLENAHKYGFILSYPDGNSYYQFEPWHWRFVGKSLARRLYEEKENFYDLNQSVIDNYLINIFD